MANLNLSEFTEKLFVADADHTFIWDTAASISKRVSRNSWLNSGTLTSDAPVTISQTWATTGIYTAFKVVANETAVANTLSNVLELWSGNAATLKLSIRKSGQIVGPSGTIAAPTYGFADTDWGTGFSGWYRLGTGVACSTAGGTISAFSITHTNIRIGSSIPFGWTSGTAENALDTILLRDGAANTLALRNGAAAQTFRIYNTFPGTGNNEWGSLSWVDLANEFQITTAQSGTGTSRALALRSSGNINFRVGGAPGTLAWQIASATGHLLAGTDNSFDIGASGANRPRNVYVGTTGFFAGGIDITGANGIRFPSTGYGPFWAASTVFKNVSNGVLTISNFAENDFGRLQFGGTTNLFPAIKRNAAGLQIRLADDSANATLEAGNLYASGNVGIGTTSPTSKLHVEGNALITGNVSLSNGSVTVLGTRGFTLTPADGIFQFLNNAQTGFDRIQLGGASTGHPAIKRNGASIDITLASDGITFTSIQDLYRRFGSGTPEGAVIAPIGAVFHRTDGGAGTSFYVKESGTGNTGWVGK